MYSAKFNKAGGKEGRNDRGEKPQRARVEGERE
jgi:hypothetical protein